jgi:type IV pilus assembly protein PilO
MITSSFRKIVFSILLFGVTIVGYRYMIKPANKNLANTKGRLEIKLLQLSKFGKAATAAEDLSKQLEELEEAIKFFENKLPPESKIHEVLEQVTVIAQKQGLKSKTFRTLKKKDNSGYVEQPLRMELVGNFSSFYSFLLELEKLPRIIKIRELKLDKKTIAEGQISADFILSIFFQNKKTV